LVLTVLELSVADDDDDVDDEDDDAADDDKVPAASLLMITAPIKTYNANKMAIGLEIAALNCLQHTSVLAFHKVF
jgi:hypothetical protein